jgi:hypothetical protein
MAINDWHICCIIRELNPAQWNTVYALFGADRLKNKV